MIEGRIGRMSRKRGRDPAKTLHTLTEMAVANQTRRRNCTCFWKIDQVKLSEYAEEGASDALEACRSFIRLGDRILRKAHDGYKFCNSSFTVARRGISQPHRTNVARSSGSL
jgi:hypothetical protein